VWFDASVDPATPARDQLLAVFDAIKTLATSAACLGCRFQVSAAEFPDRAHPDAPLSGIRPSPSICGHGRTFSCDVPAIMPD
jgi:hypothetical protein